MTITGKDLIELGFRQGPELKSALEFVNASDFDQSRLADWAGQNKPAPRIVLQDNPGYQFNLEAENELEVDNVAKVRETMDALMQTPTLRAGAVMPDACPTGPAGVIPVGAVVVDEIMPYGSIMAGDWQRDAPWRLKTQVKYAERERMKAQAMR